MAGPRETILRRLRFMRSREFFDTVEAALYEAADDVRAEASRLITTGSVSGKQHVPSPAGEAPHNNTGFLRSNIKVTQPKPFTARVTSHAEYSARHEFGPEGRAFIRPARDNVTPAARRNLVRKINQAKRKFKQ